MRLRRSAVAVVLAVASCAAFAACGDDSDSSASGASGEDVEIDVGIGDPVKTDGKPLKIALFAAGSNNSYLVAQNDEARKAAKKYGVELDIFDAAFDAEAQFNQMQTALVGKKYNAWILQALDGQQTCNIASKQAPAANIAVSAIGVALCGRDQEEGDELSAPGTLNFIGGNETVSAWKTLWEKAVEDNPGPQEVGVMTGPALNSITTAYLAAMEQVVPNDWEIIKPVETDYSVPQAQAKGQTLVQANPDMTILMSTYTNITKGAVAALESTGRLGEVKIYDGGGTITGVDYVKDGTTQATTARYSRSPVDAAVRSLVDAWAGKPGPRFISNDGHAPEQGRDPDAAVFLVTKDNADSYEPEND